MRFEAFAGIEYGHPDKRPWRRGSRFFGIVMD